MQSERAEMDRDITAVLAAIATYAQEPDDANKGHYRLTGNELQELTRLAPTQINDAVAILESSGLAEVLRTIGNHPFDFREVEATPRGRLEYQRLSVPAQQAEPGPAVSATGRLPIVPFFPTGSPYGFQDEDWEEIIRLKGEEHVLRVVFGFQWETDTYDPDRLAENIEKRFQLAVDAHNARLRGGQPTRLLFARLAAGYGEHLFNEIARSIIASDVAVFDTSDLNPNVMIEMGVALTWGMRVLPILRSDKRQPPSDISGQTYASYEQDGARFIDADFEDRLQALVTRAIQRRPG